VSQAVGGRQGVADAISRAPRGPQGDGGLWNRQRQLQGAIGRNAGHIRDELWPPDGRPRRRSPRHRCDILARVRPPRRGVPTVLRGSARRARRTPSSPLRNIPCSSRRPPWRGARATARAGSIRTLYEPTRATSLVSDSRGGGWRRGAGAEELEDATAIMATPKLNLEKKGWNGRGRPAPRIRSSRIISQYDRFCILDCRE
jgi:hypothetical protein